MDENHIIKKPEVLSEEHLPSLLLGRQQQIQELRLCLEPALKQRKPLNVWLRGRPGTGKTAVAKSGLETMTQETALKGVYVNCWEHNTLYLAVDEIVQSLRVLVSDKTESALKL